MVLISSWSPVCLLRFWSFSSLYDYSLLYAYQYLRNVPPCMFIPSCMIIWYLRVGYQLNSCLIGFHERHILNLCCILFHHVQVLLIFFCNLIKNRLNKLCKVNGKLRRGFFNLCYKAEPRMGKKAHQIYLSKGRISLPL